MPGLKTRKGARGPAASDAAAAGYNEYGQQMLDDLLTAPNTAVRSYVNKSYGQVTEYIGPAYGARFDATGNFMGFL